MQRSGLPALALIGSMIAASVPALAQWAPVPPPRSEFAPPPPPGPRTIWQRGAWDWDGHGYFWRPGHYVGWQPHYHRWIPGHWGERGAWISPHWR